MKKQNVILGILTLWLFIEWGERRTLEARFVSYLRGLHWTSAHIECSKAARVEGAKIVIDKQNYWHPDSLKFGTAPWDWPWRYFQWGGSWEVENASVSLTYSFHEAPHIYVCDYNPAGGGHARISVE